jgi:cytochrome P450
MACAPAARSIAAPQLDPGSRDALKPGVDEFAALVRDFIDEVERDAMPQHPLRGLLQLQAQHVLSRVELVDNVAFMFIAGFATTTRAIGNTVVQLLRHRWLWDACGADRSIVPKAIREMLRLDGVAHGVVRYARHDIELGGHLIRRGDEVMLLLASANHDAHVFPEPQKVELSRPSAANLAFGAGAHACIGRMVAMLEIEAVVRAMLDTMPHVTLVEQRTRWQQHGLVQGYAQIWLRHG